MTEGVSVRRSTSAAWQCPFSRGELALILAAMRDTCGMRDVAVDLTLCDDVFIGRINQERLHCSGPTNILSFPSAVDSPGGVERKALLLLSLDTLEREAFFYGQSTAEHTIRLLAHGMAHCAGLDHGPAMDAVQQTAFDAGMRAWKRKG